MTKQELIDITKKARQDALENLLVSAAQRGEYSAATKNIDQEQIDWLKENDITFKTVMQRDGENNYEITWDK